MVVILAEIYVQCDICAFLKQAHNVMIEKF